MRHINFQFNDSPAKQAQNYTEAEQTKSIDSGSNSFIEVYKDNLYLHRSPNRASFNCYKQYGCQDHKVRKVQSGCILENKLFGKRYPLIPIRSITLAQYLESIPAAEWGTKQFQKYFQKDFQDEEDDEISTASKHQSFTFISADFPGRIAGQSSYFKQSELTAQEKQKVQKLDALMDELIEFREKKLINMLKNSEIQQIENKLDQVYQLEKQLQKYWRGPVVLDGRGRRIYKTGQFKIRKRYASPEISTQKF